MSNHRVFIMLIFGRHQSEENCFGWEAALDTERIIEPLFHNDLSIYFRIPSKSTIALSPKMLVDNLDNIQYMYTD